MMASNNSLPAFALSRVTGACRCLGARRGVPGLLAGCAMMLKRPGSSPAAPSGGANRPAPLSGGGVGHGRDEVKEWLGDRPRMAIDGNGCWARDGPASTMVNRTPSDRSIPALWDRRSDPDPRRPGGDGVKRRSRIEVAQQHDVGLTVSECASQPGQGKREELSSRVAEHAADDVHRAHPGSVHVDSGHRMQEPLLMEMGGTIVTGSPSRSSTRTCGHTTSGCSRAIVRK
jgi:hypothetical protein